MDDTIYITADGIYSDIDIYACSIAYAELLKLQRKNAIAIINTTFTDSITPKILSWKFDYVDQSKFDLSTAEKLVILDRSETENLSKNINLDKVVEIYDHHFGYEEFWNNKLGKNSHIEKVGSCATLIWEEYKKRKLDKKIKKNVARLLYTAIISNTLNTQAGMTSDRDLNALEELTLHAQVDSQYVARYFETVSQKILKDPFQSVLSDTKRSMFRDQEIAIGQIEVWDGSNIPPSLKEKLGEFIPGFEGLRWLVTIASISEGKNYLISIDKDLQAVFTKIFDVRWINNVAETKKLFLRKEIMRELNSNFPKA